MAITTLPCEDGHVVRGVGNCLDRATESGRGERPGQAARALLALKVIRTGARADAKELARFRIEAEAAARLQHPNIGVCPANRVLDGRDRIPRFPPESAEQLLQHRRDEVERYREAEHRADSQEPNRAHAPERLLPARLLVSLLLLPPLVARMNAEEALLASEFGERYAAYRRRTWRLLPLLY